MSLPFDERRYTLIATHTGRFNPEERKRHIRQKEWQSCLEAIVAFEKFLRGAQGPLYIYTDHESLVYLNFPDHQSAQAYDRVMRWYTKITSFQPIIEHVAGATNVMADMLSRTANPTMFDLEEVSPRERPQNQLNALQPKAGAKARPIEDLRPIDEGLKSLLAKESDKDKQPRDDAEFRDGLWTFFDHTSGRHVVCVPQTAKHLVMIAVHDRALGHPGAKATKAYCSRYFHWEGMSHDVEEHVRKCVVCQLGNRDTTRSEMGRSYFGVQPWEQLTIDFADMTMARNGEKAILVMMDTFSGRCQIRACTEETAEVAAKAIEQYGTDQFFPRYFGLTKGSTLTRS
jgi:hypothetical protein